MAILCQSQAFAPITPPSTSSRPSLSLKAATITEGIAKEIKTQGNGEPIRFGQVATVSYKCYSNDSSQPFSQSPKQKMVVGDGVMIDGWEKALMSMTVGESASINISSEVSDLYGYGSQGVKGFIEGNAALRLDIDVLEVEEQKSMGVSGLAGVTGMTGSGDLGALDPSKPRTPEAIAAAYKVRQTQMALEKTEEKEGLEGWIEKAKSFYFFGFFEGETGEQAPWILRPSITFPIAFAVVGAGFYATFALGGISERGAQIKDELDDIVLTYNLVKQAVVVAFNLNM